MNSITSTDYDTYRPCYVKGIMCQFANTNGHCMITACIRSNEIITN